MTVPHRTGAPGQYVPTGFDLARLVVQAKLYGRGVGREHREVDAFSIDAGTRRPGAAGAQGSTRWPRIDLMVSAVHGRCSYS